ncbi:hypothetical protein DM02DRAFT_52716 [Periconia macrospinosa]|uniref:Uncharacterized protein n=1 Tax=Periconia macrospinosa TaxID=97972 RepID=A0A2V1DLT5_9PLEO|nr:hypothetical protein DM02DRAFT_52716 [Periconia macrospinosa]
MYMCEVLQYMYLRGLTTHLPAYVVTYYVPRARCTYLGRYLGMYMYKKKKRTGNVTPHQFPFNPHTSLLHISTSVHLYIPCYTFLPSFLLPPSYSPSIFTILLFFSFLHHSLAYIPIPLPVTRACMRVCVRVCVSMQDSVIPHPTIPQSHTLHPTRVLFELFPPSIDRYSTKRGGTV